jgi:hypothetical protein
MLSNTTAVGLHSPRSIKDKADRLTPLFCASASKDRPRSARTVRKVVAMRAWIFDGFAISIIIDINSFILDIVFLSRAFKNRYAW